MEGTWGLLASFRDGDAEAQESLVTFPRPHTPAGHAAKAELGCEAKGLSSGRAQPLPSAAQAQHRPDRPGPQSCRPGRIPQRAGRDKHRDASRPERSSVPTDRAPRPKAREKGHPVTPSSSPVTSKPPSPEPVRDPALVGTDTRPAACSTGGRGQDPQVQRLGEGLGRLPGGLPELGLQGRLGADRRRLRGPGRSGHGGEKHVAWGVPPRGARVTELAQ